MIRCRSAKILQLEEEFKLTFSRMWVIDGNNSLKGMVTTGGRTRADDRVFGDSDYYISEEFVNKYAEEVPSRSAGKSDDGPVEDDDGNDWFDIQQGDPTDGGRVDSDEMTNLLKSCTKNWKAASEDANKRSWDAFHETGLFAGACRHGFILWICDMIRSGEL